MQHSYDAPPRRAGGSRYIVALIALAVVLVALLALSLVAVDTLDPARRAAREAAQWRSERIADQLSTFDTLVAALWRLVPLGLVLGAAGVGLALVWRRWAAVASVRAHYEVQALQAIHQPGQMPAHLTYSPRITPGPAAPLLPAPLVDVTEVAPLALPGVTDLALLNHQPTPQQVLLGLAEGGDRVTVPLGALWHIATAGPTGNGKSNIHRLLLAQLLAMGAKVAIGDPKWTPFDAESGEDWRPIAARLHMAPAATADQIGALLAWSSDELGRRLERRRNSEKPGAPLFVCLDELPWIADNVKNGADQIGELARLGRGCGLFVMAAAQDFLVKTVSMSGARDQFRSCFYLGGDTKTGAVLLDMPQRDVSTLEQRLGVGVAMLRSAATSPAALVRIPYVSNQSLYMLLGDPDVADTASSTGAGAFVDGGYTRPARPFGFQVKPTENPFETQTRKPENQIETPQTMSAETARIIALFRDNMSIGQIVKAMYGDITGPRYNKAREEVEAAIRAYLAVRS